MKQKPKGFFARVFARSIELIREKKLDGNTAYKLALNQVEAEYDKELGYDSTMTSALKEEQS